MRREPQRLARLVQRSEAEVAAALDIDRREVHAVGWIEQEIAQVIDEMRVERVRLVARKMAQQRVRCAGCIELLRRLEKRVPQFLLAEDLPLFAGLLEGR